MKELESLPVEYIEIPTDTHQPVAWTINDYAKPTPKHFDIHTDLELGIVIRGGSRRWYEGHHIDVFRGQFWMAGLWEPHGMEVIRPNTRHLVLGIKPEFLDIPDPFAAFNWLHCFHLDSRQRPQANTLTEKNFVIEFAEKVIALMEGDSPYWQQKLRIYLQEFLMYFMEQQARPVEICQTSDSFGSRQTLLPALLMFEKNPHKIITLSDAARSAHMSRSKFSELFRQTMGIPFGKYCQRRRLAGAMRDLQATDMKLLAIAKRWGFSDAPHLARAFKTATNQTPQDYRKSWRMCASENTPGCAPKMPGQNEGEPNTKRKSRHLW